MILGRLTPCNVIEIQRPVWNGGKRKVGIATYKIGTHNEIRINAMRVDGTKVYPMPFYASGEYLKSCPEVAVKRNPNIHLYMVDIDKLETLERI